MLEALERRRRLRERERDLDLDRDLEEALLLLRLVGPSLVEGLEFAELGLIACDSTLIVDGLEPVDCLEASELDLVPGGWRCKGRV